jgi:hypothetical protein
MSITKKSTIKETPLKTKYYKIIRVVSYKELLIEEILRGADPEHSIQETQAKLYY